MSLRTSTDPFPPDPVSVHQAAKLVGVSAKTISRRLQQGHLRGWKDRITGRSLRLSRAEVLSLWAPRTVPANYRPPRTERLFARRRAAEAEAARRRVRERCGLPPD